jgi:acyl-CoA synthetase (AMP-forming)/AMP-acid ligase II
MNRQETSIREVRTVRDVIERMAEIRTDAVFLISPETGEELTFKELRQRAVTFSRRLLSLGLSKGDKVSFLLDNGLFSVELILGAMYGGFVPVPLNLAAGQSQLTYCLHHSDSSIVFVSEEYSELLHNITGQVEWQFTVIPTDPDRGPDWHGRDVCADALSTIHEEDEALLLYTSGSTGQPKGVLASHRNLLTGRLSIVSSHQLSLQDRSLCVLPLYHGNALMILMSTLLSGGSLVAPRRFSIAPFWDWVVEYHCTWFALVPTIISHLVNWTDPYAEGVEGQRHG